MPSWPFVYQLMFSRKSKSSQHAAATWPQITLLSFTTYQWKIHLVDEELGELISSTDEYAMLLEVFHSELQVASNDGVENLQCSIQAWLVNVHCRQGILLGYMQWDLIDRRCCFDLTSTAVMKIGEGIIEDVLDMPKLAILDSPCFLQRGKKICRCKGQQWKAVIATRQQVKW